MNIILYHIWTYYSSIITILLPVQKLKRPDLEYMEFDTHEQRILSEGLVDVDETNVTFKDIGGLEKELEEVKVFTTTTTLLLLLLLLLLPP